MSAQPADGDIASLTSIRGLAAFWVVLLHFSPVLYDVLPEASFLGPLTGAGVFAVPLFFVLSGYVLGLRYLARLRAPAVGAVLRFWWLRLGRVYPVHLCTLLITLAIVARRGWPADEGHTVGSFVANCLMTHAWYYDFRLSWNYPSWSISSEWFAYLLFPFIAPVFARAGRRSAAALVVAACSLSAMVYAFEASVPFKGLAVVVPTFIGGVGLAVVCPPGTSRGGRWAAGAGVLLAGLLPFLVGWGPVQSAAYLVLFFGVVASLGAAGNRAGRWWQSWSLVFLGEISYSLYMTHAITIRVMARFVPFGELNGLPLVARIAAMLACLVPIMVGAIGMYYTIERPLRNLTRRRGAAAKRGVLFRPCCRSSQTADGEDRQAGPEERRGY